MSHDLVTVGEAMLRLWVRPGARLEDTPELRVAVAGAEANVAVAMARMGRRAAWVSRLPRSVLGRRVAREIAAHGVDVSGVSWVEEGRVGTYFVELSRPPAPIKVIYDRAGSAAAGMSVDQMPWETVTSARMVHLTGITPALSDSCREVTLRVARRARQASVPVAVDVNHRPALWGPEEARPVMEELCSLATVLIVAERDARAVFGLTGEPGEMVGALAGRFGVRQVIVTCSNRGSVWRLGEETGETPAHQVEVVDRIGVGDAFAAGVLLGHLEGDPRRGVEWGTAMAALKLGTEGDQLWAGREDVERLVARDDPEVRR